MDRVENKLKWTDETFKRRIGTTKAVFHEMLALLQAAYDKRQEKAAHGKVANYCGQGHLCDLRCGRG